MSINQIATRILSLANDLDGVNYEAEQSNKSAMNSIGDTLTISDALEVAYNNRCTIEALIEDVRTEASSLSDEATSKKAALRSGIAASRESLSNMIHHFENGDLKIDDVLTFMHDKMDALTKLAVSDDNGT